MPAKGRVGDVDAMRRCYPSYPIFCIAASSVTNDAAEH